MSKFSDTASIYSTTETLVDLPVLTDSNEDAATVVSSSHSLEDAHLVLYSSWTRSDRREDDILGERLTRAGLPSSSARGTAPSGSLNPLGSLKKRLVTTLPLAELRRDWTHVLDAQNAQDVQERLDARPVGRKVATLLQWLLPDVIAVRRRTRLSVALAALYKAPDVKDCYAFFPSHRILHCPPSYIDKKTGSAKVNMQFATLTALAPETAASAHEEATATTASDKKGKSDSYKQRADAFYEAFPKLNPLHRETADEVYDRIKAFIPPSQEAEDQLTALLDHLESRGAIWTDAGHDVRPAIGRYDPATRSKVIVSGLFPEDFLDRCKSFYRNNRSPMPSDLEKSNALPLIVQTASSSSSSSNRKDAAEPDGKAMQDASQQQEGKDFLEGWSVAVTKEPYVTGSLASVAPIFAGVAGPAF